MKRTLIILLQAAMLMLLLPTSAIGQAPSHDPTQLVKENGRFWVFSTGEGVWVMSASNTNFSDWRGEARVFPNGSWPSWINTYVSGFGGHFWAPAIIHMNGKWHLYYSCSTFGSQNSAIGLATTDSLGSGNWTDQGMVTFSNNSKNVNAIDADIFRDNDGKVWMLYGSYWSGIVMTELDTTTGKPFDRDNLTYVANGNPEAAHMAEHDGYYYLFFNRFACCRGLNSNYQIFMGRSTNPTGPFLDKNGVSCSQGGGTPFLHSDGKYVGPGHFGLYEDPTDTLLTYHYYDGFTNNGSARMNVASLTWENGWPVAQYQPSGVVTEGPFVIENRNSQKVLEFEGASPVSGANVSQATANGSVKQAWIFTRLEEGYYRISPATDSTQALEVANCAKNNGANVQLGAYTGDVCQQWYLARQTNGYYRIMNRNSFQTLEIVNAWTDDGANAQQWPHNEHPTQQWIMKSTFVGLEDDALADSRISIAPNPTSGSFTVEWQGQSGHTARINLLQSDGREVFSGSIPAGVSYQIPDLGLTAGIYLVRISTGDQGYVRKLVIME